MTRIKKILRVRNRKREVRRKQNKQIQQTDTKEIQEQAWLDREDDTQGIVQTTKLCKKNKTQNSIGIRSK